METLRHCTGDRRQITYRDVQLSPPLGSSPWEHYSGLALQDPGTGYVLRDDFDVLDTQATNGQWLSIKGTGGSISLATQPCGVLSVPTAASASDYLALSTQKADFKFAAGLPIAFEAYVNVTEATTNESSWFVGLTSYPTTAGSRRRARLRPPTAASCSTRPRADCC